jgi:hypothetical protein
VWGGILRFRYRFKLNRGRRDGVQGDPRVDTRILFILFVNKCEGFFVTHVLQRYLRASVQERTLCSFAFEDEYSVAGMSPQQSQKNSQQKYTQRTLCNIDIDISPETSYKVHSMPMHQDGTPRRKLHGACEDRARTASFQHSNWFAYISTHPESLKRLNKKQRIQSSDPSSRL